MAGGEARSTRGEATIFAKQQSRQNLINYVRPMVRTIQGTLAVTPQMKHDLGISVRDEIPSPIHPPTTAPVAEILAMNGWAGRVRLKPAGSDVRGKPDGVAGANIYTFVGATPPADVNDWKRKGSVSRTTFDVAFDATLAAGTKVWICANWMNPRLQPGPACAPIGLMIGGGIPQAA